MFDLIVIGAGPGGYVAAIKAAELGKKVAVIDQKYIGGTCLNVGCIPSKTYLQHSHWVQSAKEAAKFGIHFQLESIDFKKLVAHKDQVVTQLQSGIQYLFKQHHIQFILGTAEVHSANEVTVDHEKYQTKDLLLATGSNPFVPPIPGLDQVPYLTTDSFFKMDQLPKELVIIGGGVISVELAFAIAPLGTQVTLLEVAPDLLLTEEEEVRILLKQRLDQLHIRYKVQVQIDQIQSKQVTLKDGSTYAFDQLLVATGRRADLTIAKKLELNLDEKQRFIAVNAQYQTSLPHVYAVGDAIGGLMLAHAASAEGIKAVLAMAGRPESPVTFESVPRCIYSDPEIASFGLSEAQAKDQGYEVTVAKVPFGGNGKAIATASTNGFVKLISEQKYHQILGAVIVGDHATEMIHTLLTLVNAETTVDELTQTIFAHPTLSESIGDAADVILGQSLNR